MKTKIDFNKLVGCTLKEFSIDKENYDNEFITMTTIDNKIYTLNHDQECCEGVYLHEIVGDINDIINHEILFAELVTNYDDSNDCGMWSFYKLSTIKGSITISFYGESNGYYSIEVDFNQIMNNKIIMDKLQYDDFIKDYYDDITDFHFTLIEGHKVKIINTYNFNVYIHYMDINDIFSHHENSKIKIEVVIFDYEILKGFYND